MTLVIPSKARNLLFADATATLRNSGNAGP